MGSSDAGALDTVSTTWSSLPEEMLATEIRSVFRARSPSCNENVSAGYCYWNDGSSRKKHKPLIHCSTVSGSMQSRTLQHYLGSMVLVSHKSISKSRYRGLDEILTKINSSTLRSPSSKNNASTIIRRTLVHNSIATSQGLFDALLCLHKSLAGGP